MPFIMTLKRLLPLPTVDWYCGFPREPHLSGWCLVPSYADGGLSMDWFQQVEHEKAWCNEFLISLHEGLVLLACSCWKPMPHAVRKPKQPQEEAPVEEDWDPQLTASTELRPATSTHAQPQEWGCLNLPATPGPWLIPHEAELASQLTEWCEMIKKSCVKPAHPRVVCYALMYN